MNNNTIKIKTAKQSLIDSYKSRGFFESYELQKPVKFGQPYPMLTNPFMDWITAHDLSNLTYLEIGSGASTIFFQKYFKEITSIEPSLQYYTELKSSIKSNVKYKQINKDILEDGKFDTNDYYDFGLIDFNLNRFSLTKNLLNKTKFAYLIFDTTEQYPNTCELIKDMGYTTQIDFWGFKNFQTFESCTSVFINDEIKLRLKKINRFAAPESISIYQNLEQDNEKI